MGSFGPDEWFGVLVPVLDPGADVGFEGIDTAMVAAADELQLAGRPAVVVAAGIDGCQR